MKAFGDCFVVAAMHISDHIIRGETAICERLRLCHGIAMGQGPLTGVPFTHGWVEVDIPGLGWMVQDYSNGGRLVMLRDAYYKVGQIDASKVIRYTTEEARRFMVDSGHYGPWELPPTPEELALKGRPRPRSRRSRIRA